MARTAASAKKSAPKSPKGPKKSKAKKERKAGGKKRRWRSGTVALRQIRKLQRSTKLVLRRAPLQRMVREKTLRYKAPVLFRKSALAAVQEATEGYAVHLFEHAVILQLHRKRKTLTKRDLEYTRRIRGELLGH
eukprot:TRINITY_DN3737_c0_g1_i6.p2 TRINITY_DN3737_c0_g1~~TRINITY_DN3737_c0_g1_i6.p2  ORF type:complete len:134 (+),score=54.35 TRINITY_DN3737_c0_g1_i6:78-479(+)